MCEMNPYKEGENARRAGKRRNDNPHHMATSAHDAWDDGWLDADTAIGNEQLQSLIKVKK